MRRASQWFLILAISLGLFLPAAMPAPVFAVSPDIVISQVYGGGGNSGATITHDFVELYNRGATAVDVTNWTVQYASSSGTSWQKTVLSGTIDPGRYYLVQEAKGSGGTVSLPTPNAIGSIAMSATAGKVALVNNSTTLSGSCPTGLVDFVGFGSATNCSETAPTSNLSNTTAALRNNNGATDTDNNSADFTIGAPNPRNTPPPDAAPFVVSTDPANGAGGVALGSNLTVTFSEPVNVTESWFDLACSLSDAHAATFSGGPTVFTLDPAVGFVDGDSCTLVVLAASVTDQDTEDPPDNMLADFSTSFSTGDVCLAPYITIPAIQGSGSAAAITGALTTMGVVVGDYEGASPTLRGFYLQDLTGDGDSATSDGIFVFNGNYDNVAVGDVVRVTGTAGEYQGQTQINTTAAPIACGTGTVGPVDVTFPVLSLDYLERYEGMLVRLPQTLYVTEHFQLGRFGQVVLSLGDRLMQPTNIYRPGVEADALQAANNLNRIIVDDALNNQNPDPIVFARGDLPLSASNTLRGGDTATGIVGVMTYTWSGNAASGNAYRVRPINALGGSISFEPTNPRPEAASEPAGTMRVAGMNLLNFFNTFTGCTNGVEGIPTDCRGAESQAEYDRQLAKTVSAITGTMADVVGLVEVENDGYGSDSALAALVTALNAVADPDTYAFIDADAGTGQVNALGTDAIKVGLIYKPAKVTPIGTTAALNTVEFVNGGDGEARNRPALAQAFEEKATGGRFVVAVNHLKSKGSACDDPDALDGQGNCNIVRTNAANLLWSWLADDPTEIGDTDALIVGDLNSYAREDPIEALKVAGYSDLKLLFGSWEAYSYVFDGQWGYLDHALSSHSLTPQVAAVFDWHINADEPSVLDYNTNFKSADQINSLYAPDAFRIADHDPVLIDLNLKPEMNDSFVTAGGWIVSPASAYAADPAATGKAFIPFTLKYKKGALQPTGNLQFQLLGTDLNFRSTSFDWLVINRAGTLAQFKGQGTIGDAAYQFMVWVADGKPDMYSIRIWNGDGVVYDNGALQPLGAGSIQIHVK